MNEIPGSVVGSVSLLEGMKVLGSKDAHQVAITNTQMKEVIGWPVEDPHKDIPWVTSSHHACL